MKKFWQAPICGIILVLPLVKYPKSEDAPRLLCFFNWFLMSAWALLP